MNQDQIITGLAALLLIVRRSQNEVLKAVRELQEVAQNAPFLSFQEQQLQALYEEPHPGYDCRGTCVIHSEQFAATASPAAPQMDEWLTEIESACNSALLDVYDLSIANAPISAKDCREMADCIGRRVGQIRESISAIRATFPAAVAGGKSLA